MPDNNRRNQNGGSNRSTPQNNSSKLSSGNNAQSLQRRSESPSTNAPLKTTSTNPANNPRTQRITSEGRARPIQPASTVASRNAERSYDNRSSQQNNGPRVQPKPILDPVKNTTHNTDKDKNHSNSHEHNRNDNRGRNQNDNHKHPRNDNHEHDHDHDCNHNHCHSNHRHNKSHKKGCYIATAVYGSYNCPEVWTLRRYRDDNLAKKWYGRLFIKVYYAISPLVVRLFGNNKLFNKFWKKTLDNKISKLNNNGIKNTPYHD